MSTYRLSLIFMAAFYAAPATPTCDSTSSSKIQQCIFQSELFNPGRAPKDEAAIESFCNDNRNDIVECMQERVNECSANPKEAKLVELLVSIPDTTEGLLYMCNNISVLIDNAPCFAAFGESSFYECLQNAVAAITNAGEPSDMQSGLDMVCQFFDSFTGCFTNPFQDDCGVVGVIYAHVFQGIKYPYCKLDPQQKKAAITGYEVGSVPAGPENGFSSATSNFMLAHILSILCLTLTMSLYH